MFAQATTNHTRTHRWRGKFVVAARRAGLFRWLWIISALGLLAAIWSTWFTFTNAPPDGKFLPSAQVAALLIGTLIPAMKLLVLLGRHLALKRAAGSTARLPGRLVFFF